MVQRDIDRQAGYSLVELITVIILLGVLSALIVPRLLSPVSFQARGYQDELLSAFRYAQRVAVASGCNVQVQMSAGSYALWQQQVCNAGPYNVAVPHPAESGAFAGTPPGGVAATDLTTIFGPKGRASAGGNITVQGEDFTATLTLIAESGYIYRL